MTNSDLNQRQRVLADEQFQRYRAQRTRDNGFAALQAVMPTWYECKGLTLALADDVAGNWPIPFSFWGMLMRVLHVALRRQVPVKSPAYNDYLMARWQLSGDRSLVYEMFHRAYSCSGLPDCTVASCQWMVESVSEQDPSFRLQVDELKAQIAL